MIQACIFIEDRIEVKHNVQRYVLETNFGTTCDSPQKHNVVADVDCPSLILYL